MGEANVASLHRTCHGSLLKGTPKAFSGHLTVGQFKTVDDGEAFISAVAGGGERGAADDEGGGVQWPVEGVQHVLTELCILTRESHAHPMTVHSRVCLGGGDSACS